MNSAADTWALTASSLPLAFSQVREDPRLDLKIARRLPADARAIMIASGGETAVCLARLPFAHLMLVDVNPAQLAITRCRMHLAETGSPAECMEWFGHSPMSSESRWKKWAALFEKLSLTEDIFGPPAMVAERGPDQCGRYEAAFFELRRHLEPLSMKVMQFLQMTDPASASRMIEAGTELGEGMDRAFSSALSLSNLIALFGEAATQNPRQAFHRHFLYQLREITVRLAPAENPWIWQLLAGVYPPGTPADWLLDPAPFQVIPEYGCCSMTEALQQSQPGSVDFIHLSNILDWLSPEAATGTLFHAFQALKPGGFIIIRRLNSSLEIPSLYPDFHWDSELGSHLQLMDRSFFYPEILIASRP